MLLSVCIPTYNGEAYLKACLESVCQQTYTDFEILVCDDCSIDSTIEIVEIFKKNDNRIRLVVNEKNLGLVGNWNRCIELAKGEWIKFVFQDDLILANCLQSMIEVISNNSQMVVCEREYLFEGDIGADVEQLYGKVPRLYQFFEEKEIQHISPKVLAFLIRKYYPSNFIGEPTSVMFRKCIVDKIGLFNPEIAQLCDLEYCLRIGVDNGFIYISDKLVNFRVHGTSTSQKNNSEKYFTSVYSDRIIVLYLLLFDKIYLNFRKNSSYFELFNLKYTFFYILYHADIYAKKNGKTVQKEMQMLKEKYPKIRQMQNQYFFYAPLNIGLRILKKLILPLKNKKKD